MFIPARHLTLRTPHVQGKENPPLEQTGGSEGPRAALKKVTLKRKIPTDQRESARPKLSTWTGIAPNASTPN
jgi:hypothetical protein